MNFGSLLIPESQVVQQCCVVLDFGAGGGGRCVCVYVHNNSFYLYQL